MLNVAPSAAGNMVIGVEDLEDLALGAAFLGTGGGGDPYIGRLMARHAIEEYGMPEIIEVDDLDDDATVLPARDAWRAHGPGGEGSVRRGH